MRTLTLSALAACTAIAAPAAAQTATTNLQVSATVADSCSIANGGSDVAVDLGSISASDEVTSDVAQVSFTCSLGTPYMVSADDGLHADSTQRRLIGTRDATAFLNYTLLSGDTGDTEFADDTASHTADGTQQDLALRIRIPATAQGTVRASDSYSDTVKLTITY